VKVVATAASVSASVILAAAIKELISEYLAKLQARAWLSRARLALHCQIIKMHGTITFLLVTLPNIHRF